MKPLHVSTCGTTGDTQGAGPYSRSDPRGWFFQHPELEPMAAKMLVNRATGLVREPINMPKRKRTGKTAKDRAKRGGSSFAKNAGGRK